MLTLDDDPKRNAIGNQLATELVAHARSLAANPEARALVVTGAGSAFCAGADLPEVFGRERPTDEMRDILRAYYDCFLQIRALPFPTVAAVNGPAIGAGLNLALSCDVRIAGPQARFGATFSKIGLHPGGGCSSFLVDTVGSQNALRLLVEGTAVDAETAVKLGLASSLAPNPYDEALSFAQAAANLEPWLARALKTSVAIASTSTFNAAVEFESWAQAESTHNARFRDWITQFGHAV